MKSGSHYVIITPPATQPITLDEAKAWLRVTGTAEDALITALIVGATLSVENVLRRKIMTQTVRGYWDFFPSCFDLAYGNITDTPEVFYLDTDDVETEVDPATLDYFLLGNNGVIVPKILNSWPTNVKSLSGSVWVQYETGYEGTDEGVPETLKTAIKMVVGSHYAHREHIVTSSGIASLEVAQSVSWLLSPYRDLSF